MPAGTKTDNKALAPKLALRRHFLTRYHAMGAAPRVFDACQGGGVLWSMLRREFAVANYWGVDVKPQHGRLQVDSLRILQQSGWAFDVIDCDTYGAPWAHYVAVLANGGGAPLTVFLTAGAVMYGKAVDGAALEALGLGPLASRLPPTLRGRLNDLAATYSLAACFTYGYRIVEAQRTAAGNATYYGLRLEAAP